MIRRSFLKGDTISNFGELMSVTDHGSFNETGDKQPSIWKYTYLSLMHCDYI